MGANKEETVVNCAFQWAQRPDFVYLNVKYSSRLDGPVTVLNVTPRPGLGTALNVIQWPLGPEWTVLGLRLRLRLRLRLSGRSTARHTALRPSKQIRMYARVRVQVDGKVCMYTCMSAGGQRSGHLYE